MTKWARLENNIVMELTTLDPTGRHAPNLIWIPCGEEVAERWTYNESTKTFSAFVPPGPPNNGATELTPEQIAENTKNLVIVEPTGDAKPNFSTQ